MPDLNTSLFSICWSPKRLIHITHILHTYAFLGFRLSQFISTVLRIQITVIAVHQQACCDTTESNVQVVVVTDRLLLLIKLTSTIHFYIQHKTSKDSHKPRNCGWQGVFQSTYFTKEDNPNSAEPPLDLNYVFVQIWFKSFLKQASGLDDNK